jgi:hypothetical protein
MLIAKLIVLLFSAKRVLFLAIEDRRLGVQIGGRIFITGYNILILCGVD